MKRIEPISLKRSEHFEKNFKRWEYLFDLSKDRDQRSVDVLNQVLLFLGIYNTGMNVLDIRDEPDFVIGNNSMKLGLEHTSIRLESSVKEQKSIIALFTEAEERLKQEHPELKFHASIDANQNFKFKKQESNEIVNDIYNSIICCLKSQTPIKLDLIKGITITEHDRVSLSPNFGPQWSNPMPLELLKNTIRSKEVHLSKYRSNIDLPQWLLISVGFVAESGYFIQDRDSICIKSEFDKVFVFDDGSLSLYEL